MVPNDLGVKARAQINPFAFKLFSQVFCHSDENCPTQASLSVLSSSIKYIQHCYAAIPLLNPRHFHHPEQKLYALNNNLLNPFFPSLGNLYSVVSKNVPIKGTTCK
jgi:hypothetical protein